MRDIEKDIKKLKWILILITFIELLYISIGWFDIILIAKLEFEYKSNLIMGAFHLFCVGFFIFYIWKFIPYEKKEKINNSLMIFFLGIIGMWIWLPNKKELKQLKNKI